MRSALRRLNVFVATRYPSIAATRAHLVVPAAVVLAVAAYVAGLLAPVNRRDIRDVDEMWGVALAVGYVAAALWIVLRCVDHRETAHGRGVRHLGVLWLHFLCVLVILAPAWTLAFGLEGGIRNRFNVHEIRSDARLLLKEGGRGHRELISKYAESSDDYYPAKNNLKSICSAFGLKEGGSRNDDHRTDNCLVFILVALAGGVLAHGFSVVRLSGLIGGVLVIGAVGLLAALGDVIDLNEVVAYAASLAYLALLVWTLSILLAKRCTTSRRMALGAVLLVGPLAAGLFEMVLEDLFALDTDNEELFVAGGVLMLLATPLFQLILNRYRALPE